MSSFAPDVDDKEDTSNGPAAHRLQTLEKPSGHFTPMLCDCEQAIKSTHTCRPKTSHH